MTSYNMLSTLFTEQKLLCAGGAVSRVKRSGLAGRESDLLLRPLSFSPPNTRKSSKALDSTAQRSVRILLAPLDAPEPERFFVPNSSGRAQSASEFSGFGNLVRKSATRKPLIHQHGTAPFRRARREALYSRRISRNFLWPSALIDSRQNFFLNFMATIRAVARSFGFLASSSFATRLSNSPSPSRTG